MNYGLNLEKEKADQKGDEWQFGATSEAPYFVIPTRRERLSYLPQGEVQKGVEDTMDCATRGPINILEALFTYGVQKKKFSQKNIAWLVEKGYVDEKLRVTFSDAFIAIKSGTTKDGNSLKAPIHAIYKYGLIPKSMLPLESWMRWEDYHNSARITKEMENLALIFSKRFKINYEQVPKAKIKSLNKNEMLDVAAFAWPKPINGVYPKTDGRINHAFVSVQPEYTAFDNYIDSKGNDFIKELAPDYIFYDYAYRIYIGGEDDTVSDSVAYVSFLESTLSKLKEIYENIVKKNK